MIHKTLTPRSIKNKKKIVQGKTTKELEINLNIEQSKG
jgi:hypothetical protein